MDDIRYSEFLFLQAVANRKVDLFISCDGGGQAKSIGIRDGLGSLGTGYRGVGDETCALIVGQGHERALEIAEKIRKTVGAMQCTHNGKALPKVTASIGVATAPSLPRTMEVKTVAQDRPRQAKRDGKNRVVAA
jgi:GGDEF domain-containing protein